MVKILMATAAVAVAALAGNVPAQAAEYTFALVPKNMNNPFFDQARDGCKKAEADARAAKKATSSAKLGEDEPAPAPKPSGKLGGDEK